jgi:hypothetical protein
LAGLVEGGRTVHPDVIAGSVEGKGAASDYSRDPRRAVDERAVVPQT